MVKNSVTSSLKYSDSCCRGIPLPPGLPWEWNFYSHSHPIPTGFLLGSLWENFNIFSFFESRSAEDKHATTALRLLFGQHVEKQPGKRSALVTNYNKWGPIIFYIVGSQFVITCGPNNICKVVVACLSSALRASKDKMLKFSNGDP